MGIRMTPQEFPKHRRNDPKRRAEANVFDALQTLDLDGYGLYEFRGRRGGMQVDFALWLNDLGRLGQRRALPGGQHRTVVPARPRRRP